MIGHTLLLDLGFDEAIAAVTSALGAQGFGVITRIDMHDTFAAKLGVDFPPYTILGACNPGLAHKAVSEVPEIGLLLPCNVTVQETPGGIRVCLPDADLMLGGTDAKAGDTLAELASDASVRLDRVAEALGS